jgi:hypothetical protein
MARVYLLGFGTEGIDRLVTLGSPHTPPPDGVLDQTRGILKHVSQTTPAAFHAEVWALSACLLGPDRIQ